MAKPVTILAAGGKPCTNVASLSAGAQPMTPIAAGGLPVTLVASGGYPVTLINEDGSLWSDGPALTLQQRFEQENGGLPVYQHGDETYITAATGKVESTTRWLAQTNPGGDISFAGGQVTIPANAAQRTARITLETTAPSGAVMDVLYRADGPATCAAAVQTDQVGSSAQGGIWLGGTKALTADRGFLMFNVTGNNPKVIDNVSMRRLMLATTGFDILVFAGQSNMAGASSGPSDPLIDLPHPNVYAMWGSTQSGLMTVAGGISAGRVPTQHRATSLGVSPDMAFARYYADHVLAPGRKLLIICCALGGTNLVGTGAPWNPTGGTPTLYNAMIADIQAALALGGDNRLRGVVWCQGEADRGVNADTLYPPAFSGLVSATRAALSLPNLPWVIIGINPNTLDNPANSAMMIATQESLAEGRSNGIPGVIYSGWRPEWGDGTKTSPDNTADTVHFGQWANRLRGVVACKDAIAAGAFA